MSPRYDTVAVPRLPATVYIITIGEETEGKTCTHIEKLCGESLRVLMDWSEDPEQGRGSGLSAFDYGLLPA